MKKENPNNKNNNSPHRKCCRNRSSFSRCLSRCVIRSASYAALIGGAAYIFSDKDRTIRFKNSSKKLVKSLKPRVNSATKKVQKMARDIHDNNLDEVKATMSKSVSDMKQKMFSAKDQLSNVKDHASSAMNDIKKTMKMPSHDDSSKRVVELDKDAAEKVDLQENKSIPSSSARRSSKADIMQDELTKNSSSDTSSMTSDKSGFKNSDKKSY